MNSVDIFKYTMKILNLDVNLGEQGNQRIFRTKKCWTKVCFQWGLVKAQSVFFPLLPVKCSWVKLMFGKEVLKMITESKHRRAFLKLHSFVNWVILLEAYIIFKNADEQLLPSQWQMAQDIKVNTSVLKKSIYCMLRWKNPKSEINTFPVQWH